MSDVFYIVNDVKVDPNGKPLADQKDDEKADQKDDEKADESKPAQRGKSTEKKDV